MLQASTCKYIRGFRLTQAIAWAAEHCNPWGLIGPYTHSANAIGCNKLQACQVAAHIRVPHRMKGFGMRNIMLNFVCLHPTLGMCTDEVAL